MEFNADCNLLTAALGLIELADIVVSSANSAMFVFFVFGMSDV